MKSWRRSPSAQSAAPPTIQAFRIFVCLLLLIGQACAAEPAAPDKEQVQALVRRLGSDEFLEREAASEQLDRVGEAALLDLRKALDDDDAEIRRRARELIPTIERRLFGEQRCLTGHTADIVGLAVSRDGKRALSGSNDGTVRLWDLDHGHELRQLTGLTGQVWAVAMSRDQRQAAAAGSSGQLMVWDIETGKARRRCAPTPAIRSLVLLPDGRRAITGSYDFLIRLWDLDTGEQIRQYSGHTDSVMCLACSRDGTKLASGGAQNDHTIKIWNIDSGRELRRLEGHTERIMSVAFSPDGTRLASGCWDGTVRVWDVASGRELQKFKGEGGRIHGVTFLPDGQRLAFGSEDGTLTIWHPSIARSSYTMEAHNIFAKVLSEVAEEGPADQETVRVFLGHTAWVGEVACPASGRRIVSVSKDHTLRVWQAPR